MSKIKNIGYNIEPIMQRYNPKLSERVLLKKTAGFYEFYSRFMEPSCTPQWLAQSIDESKGITMFILKTYYGLYHAEKYKTCRACLSKLLENNGFSKLADGILRFDNDGKPHLRACDLPHIERLVKGFSKLMKYGYLKEKITRILARYL